MDVCSVECAPLQSEAGRAEAGRMEACMNCVAWCMPPHYVCEDMITPDDMGTPDSLCEPTNYLEGVLPCQDDADLAAGCCACEGGERIYAPSPSHPLFDTFDAIHPAGDAFEGGEDRERGGTCDGVDNDGQVHAPLAHPLSARSCQGSVALSLSGREAPNLLVGLAF